MLTLNLFYSEWAHEYTFTEKSMVNYTMVINMVHKLLYQITIHYQSKCNCRSFVYSHYQLILILLVQKTGIVRIFSLGWMLVLNFFSVFLGASIFGFANFSSDIRGLLITGMAAVSTFFKSFINLSEKLTCLTTFVALLI